MNFFFNLKNVNWKWHLVMKQAEQEQPWTMSFRARAKRFDFKFKYSKIFPISKLFRLSIRFKLRPFTIEFKCEPKSAFSFKRKLLDLKFLQKFKCLRRKRSRNNGIALDFKNYLCGRRGNRVWLWAVASCFVILQLSSYFRTRFLWNFFSMVWNYSPLAGLLHQFSKVIYDGLIGSLGF